MAETTTQTNQTRTPGVIPAPDGHPGAPRGAGGNYRWIICGLLFFATTVNYIDRQVLGILKTNLMRDLHWTEDDFATIIFWFQVAYASGNLAAGWLMDRIGVRLGLTLSVAFWSVAAMAHAAVRSVAGFSAARFGLGLSESGNFPGAIKAVSAWFPKKERALATGIFNSGANIGALITPPLVIWITGAYGWRATFLVTGALGFFWLLFWFPIYNIPQLHPRVSPAERDHILSDPPDPAAKVPWLALLAHRQTWAFCTGMFLSAPVWWFYLYWIPDFFAKRYGLDLKNLGWPLVIIYQMTVVGSVGGGWISGALMRRGRSVNFARKTAFLICALCVVPVSAAPFTTKWLAVCLIGLAAAAHQGFAANLFTLVSDTVPRKAVSSVVGIGGMAGAIGGMLAAKIIGKVLTLSNGDYRVLFVAASVMYLVALAIIHLLVPRMEPMRLEEMRNAE